MLIPPPPATILTVARSNFVAHFGTRTIEDFPDKGNGVFYRNSHVRIAELRRGLSKTLIAGERSTRTGTSTWVGVIPGADRAMARIVGTAEKQPNDVLGDVANFSSDHVAGVNFLVGDSSVKLINDETDPRVFKAMSTRDGIIPLSDSGDPRPPDPPPPPNPPSADDPTSGGTTPIPDKPPDDPTGSDLPGAGDSGPAGNGDTGSAGSGTGGSSTGGSGTGGSGGGTDNMGSSGTGAGDVSGSQNPPSSDPTPPPASGSETPSGSPTPPSQTDDGSTLKSGSDSGTTESNDDNKPQTGNAKSENGTKTGSKGGAVKRRQFAKIR
jgi:hypothetical protein